MHHKLMNHHVGGIYLKLPQLFWHIFYILFQDIVLILALNIKFFCELVLNHL